MDLIAYLRANHGIDAVGGRTVADTQNSVKSSFKVFRVEPDRACRRRLQFLVAI